MTITISGFNHPGTNIHLFKRYLLKFIVLSCSLLSSCFFTYLDLNHLNYLNFTLYQSQIFSSNFSQQKILIFYLILSFIFLTRLMLTIFLSYFFILLNLVSKVSIKIVLQMIISFLIIICLIEFFFMGVLIISIILFVSNVTSCFFLFNLYSKKVIIFYTKNYLGLFATFGSAIGLYNPELIIEIVNLLLFLYVVGLVVLVLLSLPKIFNRKKIESPIYNNSELVQALFIFDSKNTHFGDIKSQNEYIYIAEGNQIKIYNRERTMDPLYSLNGHKTEVIKLFLTNTYLISVSESMEFVLWDIHNSFKFISLNTNISHKNEEDIRHQLYFNNMQVVENNFYFNSGNKIYINDTNFVEPSKILLELQTENRLMELKIQDNKVFCLLQNHYLTMAWIEVYDLKFNNLIFRVPEDIEEDNLLGNMVINNNTLILSKPKTILIYSLDKKLTKITQIDYENETITFLGANTNYIIIKTTGLGSQSVEGRTKLIIYTNNQDFRLIKTFEIKDVQKLQLENNNNLFIFTDSQKNIFGYNLTMLLGL